MTTPPCPHCRGTGLTHDATPDNFEKWETLGAGYPPSEVPPIRAAFDVLAPFDALLKQRCPVYELGKETTPTPRQVWRLAGKVANAVRGAVFGHGPWQIPPRNTCTTCGGLVEGGDRGDHLCWCSTDCPAIHPMRGQRCTLDRGHEPAPHKDEDGKLWLGEEKPR